MRDTHLLTHSSMYLLTDLLEQHSDHEGAAEAGETDKVTVGVIAGK